MRRSEPVHRRGQFQHVFTFIMLIIIAGIVLLLGYKFINGLLSQSCDVERLKFANNLEHDLKGYADYGSYHEPALPAPCHAEQLCFISKDAFKDDNGDGIYDDTSETYPANSVIEAELKYPSQPAPNNIFLVFDKSTEPLQFFAEKVVVEDKDVLCVNATSGKFRVGFTGRGRTVIVSDKS